MSILYRTFSLGMLLGASSILLLAQHGFHSGGSHGAFSGARSGGFGPTATAPYHLPPPTSVGRAPLAGTFANPNNAYGRYPAYSSSVGNSRLSSHGGPWRQGSSYGRRGRYRPYGFVGVPLFGYGGYPYFDDFDSSYGYSPEPYSDLAPMPPNDNGLGDQVQQLSAQMDELRNSLGRSQPSPVPGPQVYANSPESASPPSPPVTVVLKNGQTLQIQNYAVMGNTLWDFSSQPVRKIPVSNIDVPASTKATEANGAEFPPIRPGS
ncbi:MAG: hypothetical protein M3Y24_08415 [Acidobacteriota bacterium]|nr:hypothetical protein [Acidobacteriota bacterium]